MRLDRLIFLGYRDSGMEGSAENADPRAFVNQPAEQVVPRLVGIMRQERPEVVVTFDPTGGYGHPDHIAIHRHTVAAFHAAGDPTCYPERGTVWQPQRLFYAVVPRSFFVMMREQLTALGEDPSRFAAFEARAMPDEAITATVDVREQLTVKLAALAAHRTQFAENHLFKRLPPSELQRVIGSENFALAWPEPTSGVRLTDLFAGLDFTSLSDPSPTGRRGTWSTT